MQKGTCGLAMGKCSLKARYDRNMPTVSLEIALVIESELSVPLEG